MDLRFTPEEEAFRKEVRAYLDDLLQRRLRRGAGPGRSGRRARAASTSAWRGSGASAADGWTCVGWPTEHGGRGLPLHQQVICYEEYARAGGPGPARPHRRGPDRPDDHRTSASPEQQQRFLPGIVAGTELWCQGYSEPNAGSDLANVADPAGRPRRRRVGDQRPEGVDVAGPVEPTGASCWPAPTATRAEAQGHLVTCSSAWTSPGIEIRPIVQITGTAEFNEVFFSGARTPADLVVGGVERRLEGRDGHARLRAGRVDARPAVRRSSASSTEHRRAGPAHRARPTIPVVRQRLADAAQPARDHAAGTACACSPPADRPELPRRGADLQALLGPPAPRHRRAGDGRARRRRADRSRRGGDRRRPTTLDAAQRLFLFTRADTIYGGSNQIQRNIIGERASASPRTAPAR